MQHDDEEPGPAGAGTVQHRPDAGGAGDPWAGREERAVVRVTLADGTILKGSYTGRARLHFVHLTGRDQPLGGAVSGPYGTRDVRAVQIVRSRAEVVEDAEARLLRERVPGREPVTRDDHEHRLQVLACAAAAADAERDWQREMQVRRQFDRLADCLQLAAGKRAWLFAAARWGRRSNAPPTMADLWVQDVASPSCFARPRPQDFDPDPVVRRRRVPLPEHVRLDCRSIPNMLRALHDAALKARVTRLGDPPYDRGHIQVDMPMKGRSRFVVMGARDDTGRMVWRLLWDGNEGKAGRRRHRIALASGAYSRLIEVVARGRVWAPEDAPSDRGDGARRRASAPATSSAHTLHPASPGNPMPLTVPILVISSPPFATGAQPAPPPALVPACLSVAEIEALPPESRPLAAALCERGDVRAQGRVRPDGAAPAETSS